ncbi:NAD(P)-binding protein [Coniochaeta ligniaria NRRL 30616]|uniref:NAD(P)-binding protein n=1 Tax=Coniochaeta ligniaria NRRL 30616 TaxID=1408157 RepID=A0A1J7J404_9PEZI|nr:NAD(P)-binding protein [Coniochaeta ligniaria NRRL 30616]
MTTITIPQNAFDALKGKTVIITGGRSGIGEATVHLLAQHGANVVYGDIGPGSFDHANVHFKQTDVTKFSHLQELFKFTHDKFGPVDIVLANAGIHEEEDWNDEAWLDSPRGTKMVDVNYTGVVYTLKQALLSFKRSGKRGSVVITGSASSYLDSSPVCIYGGTKHGVLGLMRSTKTVMGPVARINVIAPWMVKTGLPGEGILKMWGDLPLNTAEGVAKAILYAAVEESFHGKGFWVGGDGIIECEDAIERLRPEWLTSEQSDGVQQGWERLSKPRIMTFNK